ncbi:MAG: hypothetical protein Q7V43_34735, partial [Myxococcales bacterium]|nr:hypothetical protein [Myxococcales bacterium]
MVSSVTTRGAVLAGLLAAALSQGCVRFGAAVVGGDGSIDVLDVPDVPVADALDADALDADATDVPATDLPATDLPATDVPATDAPPGCVQNDDCADPRRPLCDVATGRCVGCLTSPDTCPIRRFCDTTTETCQDGCLDDRDCAPMGNADAGPLPRRCDVVRHTCGDCVTDSDCPPGAACVGGACAAGCAAGRPCAAGLDCCDGACVDVRTSAVHCGACGVRCDLLHSNPVCTAGACAVGTCFSVFGDCDGRADNGCETSLRSTSHCGACGLPCAVPPNAAPTCDAMDGTCGYACNAGFADCDGRADNGCEVDLAGSVDHCGACGRACAPANAVGSCAAGRCEVGRCAAGFADCDGLASNGCEVDLRANTSHCGSCGAGCAAGPGAQGTCEAGVCRVRCTAGLADCDGNALNGCEADTRTSDAHCGACGAACRVARGVGACRASACAVASCEPGFADCDGAAVNGCEADLAGDGRHCGACGRACAAGQVCAMGACRAVCAGTQTACGTSCADLSVDVANCGVCGRRCGGGQVCVLGACQLDCASIGETLCAGACARTNSDPFHCGRCGNRCAAGPGATAVCVGGGCGLVCASGLGDCDGSAATGCEASLSSDLRNCGACGRACATANASAACAAGRCAIVRCDAGYGDCDGDPGNGCETALGADARHCGACGVVCGGGTVCANGACAPRPGTTVISGPTVVNTVRAAVNGAAGSTTLRLGDGVGAFTMGAQVLIHQTQSRAGDAGRYELRRVTAVGSGALTLDAPLGRGYTTDPAAGARAQAVVVQSYMDLYVAAGGVLSAPAWDGRFGGILAVDVAGDAVIEGQVSMDGRGFRGSARACSAGLYRCLSGASGESPLGSGTAGRAANGGGGGGGGSGADCAAGGGGAYGGAGVAGTNGDCNGESGGGMCSTGCPNPGGNGGAAYGGADLGAEMQLGSAGGEGGGDEDGETPGGGGNGGGAVWLRAGRTLEVPGSVTAGGSAGLDGNQSACGVGEGCGMGGGGGGAGGAVRLAAATRATLGTDRVRAAG